MKQEPGSARGWNPGPSGPGGRQEVERLLAEADRAGREGRALIDESMRLRRLALDHVPAGTCLAWTWEPTGQTLWSGVLRDDGLWWNLEGCSADPGWVEEQWMRGNLRIRDAGAAPPA